MIQKCLIRREMAKKIAANGGFHRRRVFFNMREICLKSKLLPFLTIGLRWIPKKQYVYYMCVPSEKKGAIANNWSDHKNLKSSLQSKTLWLQYIRIEQIISFHISLQKKRKTFQNSKTQSKKNYYRSIYFHFFNFNLLIYSPQ